MRWFPTIGIFSRRAAARMRSTSAEHRHALAWYGAAAALVTLLVTSQHVSFAQNDTQRSEFTAPLGVAWAMGSAPPSPRLPGPARPAAEQAPPQRGGSGTTSLRGTGLAAAIQGFRYRWFADGTIAPDPAWVAANIRTEVLPILGAATCHRLVFPQLRGAMSEIVASGLTASVHSAEYGGCYVPRFIGRDPSRPISLHTFGIAFDINVPGNQEGTRGSMDPRVVRILGKWGFAWGGSWKVPDPMHFELATLFTTLSRDHRPTG